MLKKLTYCVVPFFLQFVLRCIFLTCKWKIYNKEVFDLAQSNSRPILICCWHGRFLLVARYFKEISLKIWAVSSTHPDSKIMAQTLYAWGFKLIKGSSTRGWRNVLKNMMVIFDKNNSVVAITNDGPKGPPYIAKKGSVSLALRRGVQIIAVSGTATKYWTLTSWDQTVIPKPFSTVYIQFAAPFSEKTNLSNDESMAVSKYMNNNFNSLNNKAERGA
jgi:hypothetical protein